MPPIPPLDDSPYIDVHAMIPMQNPAPEQTPLQAAAVQAASQRAASGQAPQIAMQVPQPRIMEPQRSKGAFAIATLLLIPAVLLLIFSLYAIGSCVLICGLGGQEFARESFMMAGIWLLAAIAILSLTVALQRRARKGIVTGAWRWIFLFIIYGALIAYSWNMIIFAITGNPRYDDRLVEYNSEIKSSYEGVDCKTVTDFAGEIDCRNANDDEYFGKEFHYVAAEKNECDAFNSPYNKAACMQAKIFASKNGSVGSPAYDPYAYAQFCLNLDLDPLPESEHRTDAHYYELKAFLPYITYGQQTKQGIKAACFQDLFLSDDAYQLSVYQKVGVESRYLNTDEPIPEWEIAHQQEHCASLTDGRMKDICYEIAANDANYKQGFAGFCDKMKGTIPRLKENCIALRAESRK